MGGWSVAEFVGRSNGAQVALLHCTCDSRQLTSACLDVHATLMEAKPHDRSRRTKNPDSTPGALHRSTWRMLSRFCLADWLRLRLVGSVGWMAILEGLKSDFDPLL